MISQDKQILNLLRICRISDEERQRLANQFPNLSLQQKKELRANLLQQLMVDAAEEVADRAEKEEFAGDQAKFPDLFGQILEIAKSKEKESLEEKTTL